MQGLRRILYMSGIAVLAVFFAAAFQTGAHAFTINVVDQNGNPIVVAPNAVGDPNYAFDYRWLLEEDTTHDIQPGINDPNTLSLSIHKSYNPVVAAGDSRNLNPIDAALDPAKRYYLSVLPRNGYTMSGANLLGNATSATIHVNTLPIQTAQISVLAHVDNLPLNGFPDPPAEALFPTARCFCSTNSASR